MQQRQRKTALRVSPSRTPETEEKPERLQKRFFFWSPRTVFFWQGKRKWVLKPPLKRILKPPYGKQSFPRNTSPSTDAPCKTSTTSEAGDREGRTQYGNCLHQRQRRTALRVSSFRTPETERKPKRFQKRLLFWSPRTVFFWQDKRKWVLKTSPLRGSGKQRFAFRQEQAPVLRRWGLTVKGLV